MRFERVLAIVLLVVMFVTTFVFFGTKIGESRIVNAANKLGVGQLYDCLTEPVNENDYWYAIVRSGERYYGLYFLEPPPRNGVVAKVGKKIVFLPYSAGTTIPNPLYSPETAKQ